MCPEPTIDLRNAFRFVRQMSSWLKSICHKIYYVHRSTAVLTGISSNRKLCALQISKPFNNNCKRIVSKSSDRRAVSLGARRKKSSSCLHIMFNVDRFYRTYSVIIIIRCARPDEQDLNHEIKGVPKTKVPCNYATWLTQQRTHASSDDRKYRLIFTSL